jgi:hypothetical protein
VQRSDLPDVLNIVNGRDQDAFVTVEEPKVLSGGIIASRDWPVGGRMARWIRGRARA